jgi:hypothetical protein
LNRAVEAALFYHRRRWVPVRVPVGKKVPIGDGWQKLRPTIGEIARWGDTNVGVLMGSASGWLTDIDLDTAHAVALAPFYLPQTWVFGRPGNPRSHWIYICEGAQSHRFLDGSDDVMLEIRAEATTGAGHHTVMPGSIHTSGETIEWDPEFADGTDGPLVIGWYELAHRVADLARGTVAMCEGASVEEARAFVASYKPEPPVTRIVRQRRGPVGDAEKRARQYVARMPAAVAGANGHGAAFEVALALVQGFALDDSTALEIMHTYNERCLPPWSERELQHKIDSAKKADRVPAGYLLDGERRRA